MRVETWPVPAPATRALSAAWPRLRIAFASGLGLALALFATLRVLLSLFALGVSAIIELPGPCPLGAPNPGLHDAGLSFRLLGVWQRDDACWYEAIATRSYGHDGAELLFLPFYPVLMRLASVPLGGDLPLGGLVVSGLAYVAAMVGLYRLVASHFTPEIARRTVLLQSAFPTAFYFFAPYTESLFLALVVWLLYAARRGAWGWAAIAAAIVGITRIQGSLLAVPLAWEVLRQWRHPEGQPRRRPPVGALVVPCLPAASFLAFQVFGELLAGKTTYDVQRAWGNSLQLPWTALATSWRYARASDSPIEPLNLLCVLLFIALLALGMRRLPWSFTLYALPMVLLTASRTVTITPLAGATRYLLPVFPAFVVLALVLSRRVTFYLWFAASSVLLLILLLIYLGGAFVA